MDLWTAGSERGGLQRACASPRAGKNGGLAFEGLPPATRISHVHFAKTPGTGGEGQVGGRGAGQQLAAGAEVRGQVR